ncbi:MAG: pilus assembly protein PilM [Kiritimatiellaceae bacterium]|nr:pilus assembly protein PilM [Kiritimatiellaceae bacterium]
MNFKLKPSSGKEQGRRPANLLALDFATTGVKAVRLKKNKDHIALAAADILPPCGPNAEERPALPKPLAAYYAALCATMDNVMLRVFAQTIPEEEDIEALVRENLSVSADYRVGGLVLSRARGKRDSTLLGVAVPEKTVQHYLEIFASGAPAPHSLELSGLAALSAFLYNYGAQTENQTVCVIETGASHTYAAFLHRNQLQLINRFDVGGDALLRQVQLSLGVDAEMAGTILAGGAVDISSPIRQVLTPFTRQLSIYREFVERQSKGTLSAVYISGGLASSPRWQTAIKEVLGFVPQVWNPFEKIEILPGAFPEKLKGQEPRFAAAVGVALAGMEAI